MHLENHVTTIRKSVVAIVLLGLFCACGSGGVALPVPSQQGTVIGAQGGVLTSADGLATLEIPAGALSRDVTFDVTDAQLVPGAQFLLAAFDFQPDGTQFLVPATLTFSYDPATLPPGLLPSQLSVATEVNGAWVPLPTTHDPVAQTISATITHFSVHAAGVFETEELNPKELDRVSVDGVTMVSRGSHVFLLTPTGLEVYERRPFPVDDLQNIASLPLNYATPLGGELRIAIAGDRLMVLSAAADSAGVRLHLIDVQDAADPEVLVNPGNPLDLNVQLLGTDLAADGDRAVVAVGEFLQLIDTSRTSGPRLPQSYPPPPDRFEVITSVTMRTDATGSQHVYVSGYSPREEYVFEIVAGSSLAPRGGTRMEFGFPTNTAAIGDFLYGVEGRSGEMSLIIWDVSTDPDNPIELSSTALPPRKFFVYVAKDYDDDGILDGYGCDIAKRLVEPLQFARDGDFLYIAGGWAGARVVDVSNPDDPVILREEPPPDTCLGRRGAPVPESPPPDNGTVLERGHSSGLDLTSGIGGDGRYAFVTQSSRAPASANLLLIQLSPSGFP